MAELTGPSGGAAAMYPSCVRIVMKVNVEDGEQLNLRLDDPRTYEHACDRMTSICKTRVTKSR